MERFIGAVQSYFKLYCLALLVTSITSLVFGWMGAWVVAIEDEAHHPRGDMAFTDDVVVMVWFFLYAIFGLGMMILLIFIVWTRPIDAQVEWCEGLVLILFTSALTIVMVMGIAILGATSIQLDGLQYVQFIPLFLISLVLYVIALIMGIPFFLMKKNLPEAVVPNVATNVENKA